MISSTARLSLEWCAWTAVARDESPTLLECAGAVIVIVGNIVMANGSYNGHVMFSAGENHVQPFLAATLVDRAKVHQHFAIGPMAITNAENDDVALVPLDVLEVLDEQTDELAVLFTFALGFDEAAKFPVVASIDGERVARTHFAMFMPICTSPLL